MRAAVLCIAMVAGAVRAGPVDDAAWQATYRLHDARGERQLVVVADDDTVELRVAGEPVRVWRRLGDGLEHRAIFAADRRVVVFAPGDLRAVGRMPTWADVRGLVPSAFLAGAASPAGTVDGHAAVRHRGRDGAVGFDVTWLVDAGLPTRYVRTGPRPARLELRSLKRVAAPAAFTRDDGDREIDAADLGDEQLDPFARRYIVEGF